jgi:predicted TIM-barrel fold metal-dependent hydrolase
VPGHKPTIIAIEEHYVDPELTRHFPGGALPGTPPALGARLQDLTDARIKEMDEAGIDIQVLSHNAPATQRFDAGVAVEVARVVNDRLHRLCESHPTRFAGFAVLPTADPKASAAELERCVTRLGFKGAMIHGLSQGRFLDEKDFWPIFERAAALDVPIYMHPAAPDATVVERYYKEYVKSFPAILNAGWGFTVETATQTVRLVLSGVCEAYPGLKIIVGHLGEGIPFLLWRIDQAMARPGNVGISSFREVFCRHFWITTSGNFSDPALMCSVQELGVDRILFAVDWPYVANKPAVDWAMRIPLCAEDREKILGGNARRLLKM